MSTTVSRPPSSPSTAPSTTPSNMQSSTVFGEAESSKMAASIDPTYHAMNLTHHIYTVGFHHSQWSDVTLTFFNCVLKLHRIVIARSPYLAHLMKDAPPGATLHLSFIDDNITEEAVVVAIQHLYNPSLHLVSPDIAKPMLATSFLLGGMPDMVHYSYCLIRESISQSTVVDLIHWLIRSPQTGFPGYTSPSAPIENEWTDGTSFYGDWSLRLKSDVVDYLLHILPGELDASTLHADTSLIKLFSQLPYDLFKFCTESPDLPLKSTQDRFAFAKKVIASRKKTAGATGVEESAFLAFSDGEMAVCVTKKSKKKKALWKVEG